MTHCVVETGAFISRESESIATLTMVVSNMTPSPREEDDGKLQEGRVQPVLLSWLCHLEISCIVRYATVSTADCTMEDKKHKRPLRRERMAANERAGTPPQATRTAVPLTRRRGFKLEAALLQAAWDELTEVGYTAFTMKVSRFEPRRAGGAVPSLAEPA